MKLTERQAIDIAIELWTWMAETGEEFKQCWPGWEKYRYMSCSCPLCEYCDQQESDCEGCPLYKKLGHCVESPSSPYWRWDEAERDSTRKKYARQFLEQLKQL